MNLLEKYKVDFDTDCFEWTGDKDSKGYGRVELPGYRSIGRRRVLPAHRVMWEMIHGFTNAEHVHHWCENPTCVNPMHLEPMTQKENNRLAYSTFTEGKCKRGHTNLRVKPSGGHYCRTCNTQRMARVRSKAGDVK